MTKGVPVCQSSRRPRLEPGCSGLYQKTLARVLREDLAVVVILGLGLLLLSLSSAAAGQGCTTYALVSALDRKTGDDIANLKAEDFEARMGKSEVPIVSATQQFTARLLVLLETDGTKSEKIEDVVSLATRLTRQVPEGKPMAFGVFVKRSMFSRGFNTDLRTRTNEINELIEEGTNLGKRVALYDALHNALKLFGPHQPGDTILLISDGFDDVSDRGASEIQREFTAAGTRLLVMLRQTPSHVTGNFVWRPPEQDRAILERLSARSGGSYTMFTALSFTSAWHGYLLGIRLPNGTGKPHVWKLRFSKSTAAAHRRSTLYYPERLPPCTNAAPATTASR